MEEKRGVTLNETSSLTSLAASSYGSEGMKTSENGFGSYSAGKIRNPWEMDDWASITKAGSASVMSAKPPSTENLPALSRNVHNTVATSVENPTGGYKGGALSSSFEWPPPVNTGSREAPSVLQTSSSFYSNTQTVGVGSTEGLGPTGQRTNTGVLENFDPFVDWPPKSSSTSTGPKWSSLDETSLTNSLFNNARGNKNERQSHNNELNIGAFLASSGSAQSESQPPRKLAPPPSGLGKGRGRNPIRPIGSPKTSTSTSSNQPPLLDLI